MYYQLETNINNKFSAKGYLYLFIVLLLCLISQVVLLNKFHSYGVAILSLFIIISIYYLFYIQNFPLFLLIISILSLSYLNTTVYYIFQYLLIQNIPLAIFLLFAVFQYVQRSTNLTISLPTLLKSVAVYVGFSFFMFFLGIIRGADLNLAFNELYQNFYFFFAIPIFYLFKKEEHYKLLFKWIIITLVLISLQYIWVNTLNNFRFTTFQNHFLPFGVAALFSILLFRKNTFFQKIIILSLFIAVFWGSVTTETRTLLIANMVSLFFVVFFYLKEKFGFLKRSLLLIALCFILLVPITLLKGDNEKKVSLPSDSQERFEAIANPTGDIAFLMRVEAVYLGIHKFLKHPIIGEGFGFKLQLKWLLKTAYLYPDNSFLYYLLKGGIIFFLLALWMYYLLLKRSYDIFKYSSSVFAKYMSVAIISGMIGILLTGMLNANLVRFKLNILYAVFFAFIEYEYIYGIKKKQIQSNK